MFLANIDIFNISAALWSPLLYIGIYVLALKILVILRLMIVLLSSMYVLHLRHLLQVVPPKVSKSRSPVLCNTKSMTPNEMRCLPPLHHVRLR